MPRPPRNMAALDSPSPSPPIFPFPSPATSPSPPTLPDRATQVQLPEAEQSVTPRIIAESEAAFTVLVVDDDSAAYDLLATSLRRAGYRPVHAKNGDEALELARRIKPDAITLDVMMPQTDGWTVLMTLKADAELCEIPVVMVTMVADRGMGLSLGAAEFMTKPVDRIRLTAVMNGLLRRDGPALVVEDDAATRDRTRPTLG